jgi:ATP-dependent DNA helicase PIF1
MQQSEAFQLMTLGKNVFLTGAAGSGKTYVLNRYITYLKNAHVRVAVTASTGIAATHLQGTTIHSWSGIGIRKTLSAEDLAKIASNKRIKNNFKKAKVLIIDEISMIHAYLLDMVDCLGRLFLEETLPFGGLQLILCGDFFQLPPVSSSSLDVSQHFAFNASSWNNANLHVCYLHEQHRQGNDPLLTILNDIRSACAGEHTKVPLRTRYNKEPVGKTKATKLYALNVDVDAINHDELAQLKTPEKQYHMQTRGFDALVTNLKRNCLAPEQLTLKVGAEVMFVKNNPVENYCNGTRGVVIDFAKDKDAWPTITKQ